MQDTKVENHVPPGSDAADLTACDREPIHRPGAIQPHGLLLVAEADTLSVIGGAGDLESNFGPAWNGQPLSALLGGDAAGLLAADRAGEPLHLGTVRGPAGAFEAIATVSGPFWLLQLEPAEEVPSASVVLSWLDAAGGEFERASDLRQLANRAAAIFRQLTGFDRVMIYRFLDDGAGIVLSEDRDPALSSFLNHHFPASDIPLQARALYIRNRVRVIPDAEYVPAPLRSSSGDLEALDLSDVDLRSVSPIHVQYLKNMGVRASASVSIVKDGLLWGMVACHHRSPRTLPRSRRLTCQTLSGELARQIRAKEEAEDYRDRLRFRAAEDAVVGRLYGDLSLADLFAHSGDELRRMLDSDGFVVVSGKEVHEVGHCPDREDVREIASWLKAGGGIGPLHTHELGKMFPPAAAYAEGASGLLAVRLSAEEPTLLMWFRAEHREVIRWAGDPHKAVTVTAGETLTPRASFEAWSEEVRGKSRPWSPAEIEGAHRLTRALLDARQTRRIKDLVRDLTATLADKQNLLAQKDHLLKEVNHRIQNSLQLVSAFLAMQGRASGDEILSGHLAEAQRRLSAVALVHRRLYSDDNVEMVDLARYIEELCADVKSSMGPEWADGLTLDLAPILLPADSAVNVGLILTELLINANKYAYRGAPGPVFVSLEQHRNRFRLIVADSGLGKSGRHAGFGTRMLQAMVDRLKGSIEETSNKPGLRVIVTAPILPSAAPEDGPRA